VEAVIAKARKAWRFARKYWKALAAGLSVLLVLAYTALSNRNRRKSIKLKRQAHEAEGGKVERVKDAVQARAKAGEHGRAANRHQKRAGKVIEKLKAKEGKRMGAAEARELAERIAGEG
jgi:membrane protein implicated in regulation of membrane protease activity